jgi:hypothetical protein
MTLQNYREITAGGDDLDAGFQFEFSCAECGRVWRSPFKPYRMGQLNGVLRRVGSLFSGRIVDAAANGLSGVGARGAKDAALAEAQALAAERYVECPACHRAVCKDCMDTRDGICTGCARRQADPHQAGSMPSGGRAMPAMTCPGCGRAHAGGRFCAECGFDMAATHKTCPGCGVLAPRQARFCVDCGHAF